MWPEYEAEVEVQGQNGGAILVDSPRAGGIYLVDEAPADVLSVATD